MPTHDISDIPAECVKDTYPDVPVCTNDTPPPPPPPTPPPWQPADDKAGTKSDTPVTIDVLANDGGTPAGFHPYSVTGSDYGEFVINDDNTITFTPDPNTIDEDVEVVVHVSYTDDAGNQYVTRLSIHIEK